MKYMFLMYGDEHNWNETERRECMTGALQMCEQLAAAGKFIATAPLDSIATAKTVRRKDGQLLITDGPFAETVEHLGGFFILELDNLDEALAIAAKLPPVKLGTAEIRPLAPIDGMPPRMPIPENVTGPLKPYLLAPHATAAAIEGMTPEQQREGKAKAIAFCEDLRSRGRFIDSSPLAAPSTATCVRVRNGKTLITDGPFAETHEVLGGYFIVLAESPEDAAAIASDKAGGCSSTMEVRPLFDIGPLKAALGMAF